jgi:uncharacterized protein (DUF433 family)
MRGHGTLSWRSASRNDFLEWFPGVEREQVEAVLAHAERSLEVA